MFTDPGDTAFTDMADCAHGLPGAPPCPCGREPDRGTFQRPRGLTLEEKLFPEVAKLLRAPSLRLTRSKSTLAYVEETTFARRPTGRPKFVRFNTGTTGTY